jgi:predicted ATPase
MKLLSITLDGEQGYKGLTPDTFDFSQSEGPLLALVGLNGSGKSQLLELIGETFAYLERYKRSDFKTQTSLGFSVSVVYQINIENDPDVLSYPDELIIANNFEPVLKVSILQNGSVTIAILNNENWQDLRPNERHFPMPNVIGYSSGLNENLQRSFMKNAVQFFDVTRIKSNMVKLQKKKSKLGTEELVQAENWYKSRYKEIFDIEIISSGTDNEFEQYTLKSIDKPKCQYLDYDCAALLFSSLSVLDNEERNRCFSELKYKHPIEIEITYSLQNETLDDDDDDVSNIKRFIDISSEFTPLSKISPDVEEEDFEGLDFIAGKLKFDLEDEETQSKLSELNYSYPLRFFERLYGLQLLGVNTWQDKDKENLRNDSFMGCVKKPLKTQLPIEVTKLVLADDLGNKVLFDDLSDGEIQLMLILSAVRVFQDRNALYLFDEPETHLNPAWRTYFHQHLLKALVGTDQQLNQSQIFLSTHSPFMISSLPRNNVYQFKRVDGVIQMNPAENQTYGASFDVLIKEYFDLKSLISQTVVEDIKDNLPKDDSQEEKERARRWLTENIGESMEKAYLLRKLQD